MVVLNQSITIDFSQVHDLLTLWSSVTGDKDLYSRIFTINAHQIYPLIQAFKFRNHVFLDTWLISEHVCFIYVIFLHYRVPWHKIILHSGIKVCHVI